MSHPALSPERVADIRKALDLTQEKLAHLLGVTWTTVNRWEAGTSSPTGMAARLLYLLETAAKDARFRAALRDPRSGDPMFAVYQLLSGFYHAPRGAAAGRR